MKNFKKPYEIVDFKGFRFVLFDGTETKSVFGALPFDDELGAFPIIDRHNKIVEYMDIVGNFTKEPTQFAKCFNNYMNSNIVGYGNPCFIYFTSLLDLPSKYLIDDKIRKIIREKENYKIQNAKHSGEFANLIEVLRYRCYVNKIYREKTQRAKNFIKKINSKQDVQILYYDL